MVADDKSPVKWLSAKPNKENFVVLYATAESTTRYIQTFPFIFVDNSCLTNTHMLFSCKITKANLKIILWGVGCKQKSRH
jgi:hypothetical protein